MKIGRAAILVVLASACSSPASSLVGSESAHDVRHKAVVPAPPRVADQSAPLGDDDYAIYEAVMQHQWIDAGRTALIVRRETADASESDDFDRASEYLRTELGKQRPPIALGDDLLDSYGRVHARRDPLDPKRFKLTSVTVSATERTSAQPAPPPSGAVITLSRIGFAPNHTLALLSASHYCGGLCGAGYFFVVEKVDGRWRVAASVMSWIA